MTFEEAYAYTSHVGSVGSYTKEQLRALWEGMEAANPSFGHMDLIEIGCEYGRSTSLIMQWLCDKNQDNYSLYLIDPFTTGHDVMERCMRNLSHIPVPFVLCKCSSADAYWTIGRLAIGNRKFLHVDGDHEPDGLKADCRLYVSELGPGDVVAFHDYGCPGLPHIKPIVDTYTKGWEVVAHRECCYVVRKPYG